MWSVDERHHLDGANLQRHLGQPRVGRGQHGALPAVWWNANPDTAIRFLRAVRAQECVFDQLAPPRRIDCRRAANAQQGVGFELRRCAGGVDDEAFDPRVASRFLAGASGHRRSGKRKGQERSHIFVRTLRRSTAADSRRVSSPACAASGDAAADSDSTSWLMPIRHACAGA